MTDKYKSLCGVGYTNGKKMLAGVILALDKEGNIDYSSTIAVVKQQLLKSGSIPQRIMILVV